MNVAILAAAAMTAFNPSFVGDWCQNVKGVDTLVMSISRHDVKFYQPGTAASVCAFPKVLSHPHGEESEVDVTANSMVFGGMNCSDGPSNLNAKIVLVAPDKLKWYNGTGAGSGPFHYVLQNTEYKCNMNGDD